MDSKIEDLRKQAFNEINRLEAMMEKDQQESKHYIHGISQSAKLDSNHIQEQITQLSSAHGQTRQVTRSVVDQLKEMEFQVKAVLKVNPQAEINKIQRKLINGIVQEITTPM